MVPAVLVNNLQELGVPGRMLNFTAFLTMSHKLHFSANGAKPKVTRLGIPQGGVFSSLLFNLDLKRLEDYLPKGVMPFQYADDLLLGLGYHRVSDSSQDNDRDAYPLAKEFWTPISLPKCQLCIFTKGQLVLDDICLTIEGYVFFCQAPLL